MNIPSFRPARPFLYSLFVVSVLASKLLHLYQHGRSLGALSFVLYFPTFFLPDIFVAVLARILLHANHNGVLSSIGLFVGGFLAVFCFTASASQLGFYYVTGAEMQWGAATSVASDPVAVRLMMTGIWQVMTAGLILLVPSFAVTPFLYNMVGAGLVAIQRAFSPANWTWEKVLPTVRTKPDQSHRRVIRFRPLAVAISCLSLLTLQAVRPARPYNHISMTLPFSLLHIIHQPNPDSCAMLLYGEAFPLTETVAEKYWETPRGNFKGWAPGTSNYLINKYKKHRPEWLPKELPSGFHRWEPKINVTTPAGDKVDKVSSEDPKDSGSKCSQPDGPNYYNPVADPLRIPNLDLEIYESLKQAFEASSVLVSHIVLISMESARKGVFPLREGSNLHSQILESHQEDFNMDELSQLLSRMTPVAQQVTGEPFWNDSGEHSDSELEGWKDSALPGMGGLNVQGAVTGSTLSFKSVLGSHCGVYPIPTDFMEETTTEIYQPCIPQIMELFNRAKDSSSLDDSTDDRRAAIKRKQWRTMNVQSATDTYDRQKELNKQMNFSETVSRETLKDTRSKYYNPKSKILHYFGYPDAEVEPCFRDAIFDAANGSSRLFLSHFTSTTHHPWKVPKSFSSSRYMGSHSTHSNMNKYLNTVSYVDDWLGDILGILDEAGIANETLVVFIGDHGQAFEEDSEMTGTYENPHISNFRVPIVFRHPHLPRINIEANATSMSILPTILDLLVSSDSLDPYDKSVASDLVHEYQGQSLLRPFRSSYKNRQSWNVAVINPGGAMIAVSSAAVPWRFMVPLKTGFMYRFSNLDTDPNELEPIEEWSLGAALSAVQKHYGKEAKAWVKEADAVGNWWVKEMHRLWNYEGDLGSES